MKRTMIALALASGLGFFGLGSTAASAAEFCVAGGLSGVSWIRPARASKCSDQNCVKTSYIDVRPTTDGQKCGFVPHLRVHGDWCIWYNGVKYVGRVRGKKVVFGG